MGVVEVAVKVGRQSDLILNGRVTRAYRAINERELLSIVKNNKELRLIIIENIKDHEYDGVKSIIEDFRKRDSSNKVMFYVKDNDSTTCGMADELDYDIYLDECNLHRAIKNHLEVYLGVDLDMKPTLTDEGVSEDIDFDDVFDLQADEEYNLVNEEVQVDNGEAGEGEEGIHDEVETTIKGTKQLDENRVDLEDKLEKAIDEAIKLKDIIEAIEDERDNYKEILDSLHDSDEVIEEPISLEEYQEITSELERLKNEYSKAQIELKEKTEEVERLTIEIGEVQARLGELEVINREQEDKIGQDEAKINSIESEMNTIKQEIEDYEKTVLELNSIVIDLQEREMQASTNAENIKIQSDMKIDELRKEKEILEEEKGRLENELTSAKLGIKNTEKLYNELTKKIEDRETDIAKLTGDNSALEEVNKYMRDQLAKLKVNLDKANKDRLESIRELRKAEEINKQLKESFSGIGTGVVIGESIGVKPMRYSGEGRIISVFGCGSFGITTTAMSIANRMSVNSRVLYVDLDMVTPKADTWFKRNPTVRDIPKFDPSDRKSTGLGLLVDRGVEFFLKYHSAMVFQTVKSRRGCIDYISGFYIKPDIEKFVSTNYETFFNYCGDNYDYVVVDLGKLGYSEITDSLIRAVTDISYVSIAVTPNDRFEIRTLGIKMDDSEINNDGVTWLINMCTSTNLDTTGSNYVNLSRYAMMPFNQNIHGKKIDFMQDRLNKERFDYFMRMLFKTKGAGV